MKYVTLFFTLHVILLSYLYTHFWFPSERTDPSLLEALRHASCSSVLDDFRCEDVVFPDKGNCRIVFAYSAVQDLIIDSKEVLKHFPQVYATGPAMKLNSLEDVLETIAYHFHTGIAGEYRVEDSAVFSKIISSAESSQSLLGGNAAMMALRAYHLGCSVGLAAPLSKEQASALPKSVQILTSLVSVPDVHLVLEYKEGQRWGSLIAPRGNRLYLNHDHHMLSLDFRDILHKQDLKDFDILAIGGLQLMQNSDFSSEVLRSISEFVSSTKKSGKTLHFEFADVKNETFYREVTAKVVKLTDSLGMNEQELKTFNTFLSSGILRTGWASKPSVSDVVGETVSMLREMTEKGYEANRVHVHSPLTHVLCGQKEKWGRPDVAVARGALLAGQIACNSTDLDPAAVELNEQEVVLVQFSGEKTHAKFNADHAVLCWEPDSHYQCCTALVPYCREARQTRALGDNISGAGLALHRRI